MKYLTILLMLISSVTYAGGSIGGGSGSLVRDQKFRESAEHKLLPDLGSLNFFQDNSLIRAMRSEKANQRVVVPINSVRTDKSQD